jgi:hypothetical protein
MRASATVLVVVVLASVGEAQLAIRPGQYELTVEMNLGGIPADAPKAVLDAAGFQKQKKLECLTAADVKGDITQMLMREMADSNCKMSDLKWAGSRVTFTTTCAEDDIRMVMNHDVTVGTDSFTSVAKGQDNKGNVSTVKTSARRVGDC